MKRQYYFYIIGSIILAYLIILDISNYFKETKDPYDEERQLTKSIKCQNYGSQSLDPYLRTYTVKSGDSLSLIAKRELGSIEMTDEIISLNRKNYPGITRSTGNVFIKPGWKFYLPIKTLVKFHGELGRIAGLVLEYSPTKVNLSVDSKGSSISTLIVGKNKDFPGQEFLKKGNCVYILHDTQYWLGPENILEVEKQ